MFREQQVVEAKKISADAVSFAKFTIKLMLVGGIVASRIQYRYAGD